MSTAQRQGTDTLNGYIVKAGNDTIIGKVVLSYKMLKEKKEFHKEYGTDEWYKQVNFIDAAGTTNTFTPEDIHGYGWKWDDTSNVIFRSTKVVIPHKGALLLKNSGNRFLKLEMDGPISLFLYHHSEMNLGGTNVYNDRYLKNENGEMQVLKIKAWLGIAYNLTDVADWFAGYPGLSKFNIKDMIAPEVWLLVAGYNDWKLAGN
jgi:hypothetical protein